MQRVWSSYHVFSDPITFALPSWRSYRVRSAIRHVRMKHYPNTWLFVLNNFAYISLKASQVTTLPWLGNANLIRKGKRGKEKSLHRNLHQNQQTKMRMLSLNGESASIAKTSESPDIAMETCSQPNNKKAKVITNLNLNSCFGRNLSPGLLRWSSIQSKEGQMRSEYRSVGL